MTAAETLAALYVSGGIAGDLGEAGDLLVGLWRSRNDRFNREERQAFFRRLFGGGSGDGPSLAVDEPTNEDFEALLIDLAASIHRLDPEGRSGLGDAVALRTSATLVGASLSDRRVGIPEPAARELLAAVNEALAIFKQPPIQRAVGALGPWSAVAAVTRRYLREQVEVPLHVERARTGLVAARVARGDGRRRRIAGRAARSRSPRRRADVAPGDAVSPRARERRRGGLSWSWPRRLPNCSRPQSAPMRRPTSAVRCARSCSPHAARYEELPGGSARRARTGLVHLCRSAAALSDEEEQLAEAQSAGDEFSGVSAERVAGTTRAILNAVSFPRFVTELINGVFKAIIDSNMQQLDAYVDLLNNVAASTEGFAETNMGPDRARHGSQSATPPPTRSRWRGAEERDPNDPFPAEHADPDEDSGARLRLRPGGSPPSQEALRTDFGMAEGETVPTGDPERSLVPLARRQLARTRQEMLATMVMLGMQRIVIESGRIAASMRFHIDTRSAAQDDRGSRFDFRNTINAPGSFGFGPWGVSAVDAATRSATSPPSRRRRPRR